MATGLPHLSLDPTLNYDPNPRPTKRRRRQLIPEVPSDGHSVEILPEDVVSQLLNRSTAMVLQSVGFSGATAGVQERVRTLAEDYYLQMLQTVGLFALAQRRTKPTVLDFEEMLLQNHINLAGLEDELHRLPSKAPVVALSPPTPPAPPDPDLSHLLGQELDGSQDRRCQLYEHLPPFPSRHTYQVTPVFSERPTDPRMIREKATAEARLAEVALRKLLAVSSTRKDIAQHNDVKVGKKRKERHDEWKKAFQGLNEDGFGAVTRRLNGHQEVASLSSIMDDLIPLGPTKMKDNDGYLEVIVNSDSQFWRKGKGSTKRSQTA